MFRQQKVTQLLQDGVDSQQSQQSQQSLSCRHSSHWPAQTPLLLRSCTILQRGQGLNTRLALVGIGPS